MFAWLLAVLGVLIVLTVVFLPRIFGFFARRSNPPKETPASVTAVLRWLLAEAIAVYGTILDLRGTPLAWTIPFYAVGVILLVVYAPWFGRSKLESRS